MKNPYRAPRFITSTLVLLAICIGTTVTAQEAPTAEQMKAMAERAAQLGLPEDVIQLTPCVPTMGEHWADPDPKNMPLGPIYGVINDEVVFVELMPAQADFADGKS